MPAHRDVRNPRGVHGAVAPSTSSAGVFSTPLRPTVEAARAASSGRFVSRGGGVSIARAATIL
jgi:hypothetical protein